MAAYPPPFPPRHAGKLPTIKEDSPGVGPLKSHDESCDCRFPGSAPPNQSHHLAIPDFKANIVHRQDTGPGAEPARPEGLADPLDPEQRRILIERREFHPSLLLSGRAGPLMIPGALPANTTVPVFDLCRQGMASSSSRVYG